jgi:hypothetical protein
MGEVKLWYTQECKNNTIYNCLRLHMALFLMSFKDLGHGKTVQYIKNKHFFEVPKQLQYKQLLWNKTPEEQLSSFQYHLRFKPSQPAHAYHSRDYWFIYAESWLMTRTRSVVCTRQSVHIVPRTVHINSSQTVRGDPVRKINGLHVRYHCGGRPMEVKDVSWTHTWFIYNLNRV